MLIGMAYNILRIHRRYLMRQGMDEIIEHLQINLAKDFGYEDDVAIEKLREVINELASNRLDWPGRPPPEELPQQPFGMPEVSSLERELGLRTAITEKEREFSAAQAIRGIGEGFEEEENTDDEGEIGKKD